jgi:hypothetical protein
MEKDRDPFNSLVALVDLMTATTPYLETVINDEKIVFDLGTDFILFILCSIICFIAIMFSVEKRDDED